MSYAKYNTYGHKDTGGDNDGPAILEIENEGQKEELVRINRVVCVDVSATWCMPCKKIAPEYARMAERYNKQSMCLLCKENVDLGLSPDVTAVPTFQFYKDGELKTSISGADLKKVEQVLVRILQMA